VLKALVYSLYPRGSVRPVLRGCRKGCRFVVRDAMGVSFSLGLTDEEEFASRFRQLIPVGCDVVDVGANRGQMALLFGKLVGPTGRVVSIEPMPELVADLKKNCELSKLENVTAVCAAAAASVGEMTFSFPENAQTQGKLLAVEPTYKHQNAREVTVKTTTIDLVVEELGFKPAFMKVDVEGAGAIALRGAQATLAKYRPRILMELHGPEEVQAARELAAQYGYRMENSQGTLVTDPGNYGGGPLFFLPA
jgi:FkbM family methyltransferase